MTGGSSRGGAGDGRLDLDELGGIVDAPGGYRLGDASSDTDVLGDDSRVSLGERLEAAGVLPFVRRHRVLLGAAATVVVGVSVAGTAYANSRPPKIAATPGVEVFSVNVDNGFIEVSGLRTAQQSYLVVPDDATTAARVDAIRGPGIRTSTAVDLPGTAAGSQQTLLAVLECDARALLARTTAYQIHVRSTDVWGRGVDGWIDAPTSNLDWAGNIANVCWEQLAWQQVRLESVDATPDLDGRAIDLTLEVSNGLPVPAVMSLAPYQWVDTAIQVSLSVVAAPRSTVQIPGRLRVLSCGTPPAAPRVTLPTGRPDVWLERPGLPITIIGEGQQFGSGIGLPLDDGASARIQTMLTRICAGSPQVELVGATYAPAMSLGASGVQVPLNLRLRLPADVTGTAVSTGVDDPSGNAGTPVDIRAGRVSVPWAFSCEYVPQPVAITVQATDRAGSTWPFLVDVPLSVLADAAVAACPTFTPQRLVEEGGWVLDGVEPTYLSGG